MTDVKRHALNVQDQRGQRRHQHHVQSDDGDVLKNPETLLKRRRHESGDGGDADVINRQEK